MFDLIITNGTLVTAEATTKADLGILGGRIVALGRELVGRETLEAGGLLVLPGAIDEHVHLQMPVGTWAWVSSSARDRVMCSA